MNELLSKALDDDSNAHLFDLTSKQIKQEISRLISELNLSREYEKKLKGYRFIEDSTTVKPGSYVRWIKLDDFSLSRGVIFCELVNDNTIQCKSFSGRHFQIQTDEILVFQKLTNQELVILSAMDHLIKPIV